METPSDVVLGQSGSSCCSTKFFISNETRTVFRLKLFLFNGVRTFNCLAESLFVMIHCFKYDVLFIKGLNRVTQSDLCNFVGISIWILVARGEMFVLLHSSNQFPHPCLEQVWLLSIGNDLRQCVCACGCIFAPAGWFFQMGLLLECVSHLVCWGAHHSVVTPDCFQTCLTVRAFHVRNAYLRLKVKYHLSYLLLQPPIQIFTCKSSLWPTSVLRF